VLQFSLQLIYAGRASIPAGIRMRGAERVRGRAAPEKLISSCEHAKYSSFRAFLLADALVDELST